MNHTLEHLKDAFGVLRRLKTVLRRGGILAIAVPNEIGCLVDRVRSRFLCRDAPPATDENMHALFLDVRAVAIAVERAGLAVLRLSTVRHSADDDTRLPLDGQAGRFLFLLQHVLRTAPFPPSADAPTVMVSSLINYRRCGRTSCS